MQRLSYPTETVLTNEITRNRIVLSFKDSLRKPLGRRPGKREREREREREMVRADFRSFQLTPPRPVSDE